MGLWIKPSVQYPAITLGRKGTVLLAEKSYHLPEQEPPAYSAPIPRSERPTHHGDGKSRKLVYWCEKGQHIVEIGAGPWSAWCAEGEGVFDLVTVQEAK